MLQQRHAELRQHAAQQQHRQTHYVEEIAVDALHQQRPETLHARTPLYIGSARDVEAVEAIYAKYPD